MFIFFCEGLMSLMKHNDKKTYFSKDYNVLFRGIYNLRKQNIYVI